MATTAGALSAGTIGATSVALTSAAATGGTAPYTYQWYRSTVPGFTPSAANDIVGATTLTYTDTGLIPGTQYYYEVVATDAGAVTGNSAELSVLTLMSEISQNSFEQSPYVGMLDLNYNYNTIAAQIDNGYAGTGLYAGQAVKFTNDAGGVPKVEACAADTDVVAGFINYNIKSKAFIAYDTCEISQAGNVMYLMSTAAIARGGRVMIDTATVGGVTPATTGKPVCGFALDVASAGGQLIRIELMTPSFSLMP